MEELPRIKTQKSKNVTAKGDNKKQNKNKDITEWSKEPGESPSPVFGSVLNSVGSQQTKEDGLPTEKNLDSMRSEPL